jgi:Ni,Fe-hydrogenase I small subunit
LADAGPNDARTCEASGQEVLDLLGAAAEGKLAGTGVPLVCWVQRLAAHARYTLAVETCAAFGGVTAGGSDPTDACGVQYDGLRPGGLT